MLSGGDAEKTQYFDLDFRTTSVRSELGLG